MKATLQTALLDLQARFALLCSQGELAGHCEEFFASDDLQIQMPGLEQAVTSREELKTDLTALENAHREQGIHTVHLFHTPYLEEENGTAFATWETYSYHIESASRNARMQATRFAAELVQENGRWVYRMIDWTMIQQFEPQNYDENQQIVYPFSAEIPDGTACMPQDYLHLRNLTNVLASNNWRDCVEFFADDAAVDAQGLTVGEIQGKDAIAAWLSSIADYERKNGGRYRCLMLMGPGAVTMQDENHACGTWQLQTFEVSVKNEEQQVLRRMMVMRNSYVRAGDGWKIAALQMHTLLELPMIHGSSTLYGRMSMAQPNWLYADFAPFTPCTEMALNIENIFSFWPNALHRGNLMAFYENLVRNDQEEYWLSIRSRGPETPNFVGDKSITDKLSGMDKTHCPGQLSYHCATTPLIQAFDDGNTVRASWIDHSLTNRGLDAETNTADYMVFVSRYEHTFRKIGGKWYLVNFNWEPCLGLPFGVWRYCPGHYSGQAPTFTDTRYPFPLNCKDIPHFREK